MRGKRLPALLMALALVFALAACAASGERGAMTGKDVEAAAAGSAPEYAALIAAVEQAYNDPDVTLEHMMTVCWGAAFSEVMQDFLSAAREMGEAEPEALSDIDVLNLPGYAEGSEVKLEIVGATPLTEAELQAQRDKLKAAIESLELIKSLSTMYDDMTEEDFSENGLTPDEIARMKLYMDKLLQIGAVYEGSTIEQGCALKLKATVDGKASELEKTALLVNGSWVFSEFIDLMD
jgi:hypothetical protein